MGTLQPTSFSINTAIDWKPSSAPLRHEAIVPTALTPLGLASAVASGALYYAGAYWFYLGALRHVPASYASVSFYLIPIVGVTAGALLLGERLDAQQWAGAVIVLGSVLAILRQPTAAAVPSPSPVAAD